MVFECNFLNEGGLIEWSFCTCDQASVTGDGDNLLQIQGTHMAGKGNSDVEALTITNQNLISAEDLKPFLSLRYLALETKYVTK